MKSTVYLLWYLDNQDPFKHKTLLGIYAYKAGANIQLKREVAGDDDAILGLGIKSDYQIEAQTVDSLGKYGDVPLQSYKFWIKSSRGTNKSEMVQLPKEYTAEDIKAELETWCARFGAWSHSENSVRYGFDPVKKDSK
jgi:hypothetical protein